MENENKPIAVIPYQCCPACNGYGERQPIWNIGAQNATLVPCDVCDGAKIIPMHIINPSPDKAK